MTSIKIRCTNCHKINTIQEDTFRKIKKLEINVLRMFDKAQLPPNECCNNPDYYYYYYES